MKTKRLKIFTIVLVSIFLGCFFFLQKVFERKEKKYLFLGSIRNDSLKVSEDGKMLWLNRKELNQIDKLTSKEFLNKLYSQKLQFEMEGYEPFWSAKIYKNELFFTDPESGIEKKYDISYVYNSNKENSGAYFSFSDHSKRIYGQINYLGMENTKPEKICEYNLSDENSLYDAFITVDGILYKGCSVIVNQK